ncbi:hypothetical protein QBC46DRAFT_382478 [Diplogelasinospora grovesii]|uniref:non-specific serine/threonine protein kinase n=1 Tax=Diplogelasinospora grovesii TaxID=303347 RepID=A0AAN6N9A1_9PEZI|nr:hypothetical protein QBC46DRAFT_382478 [Diplogelasinospora grovesii]
MAQVFFDMLYSLGSCLNCFPGSPTLKINSRSFKILRLLGEGGFSYVYLVQDTSTAELFALKKIRCPFGAESVAQAMKEVEAYKLFSGCDGIIHSIDYSVATERGGSSSSGIGGDAGAGGDKTVYILLPYYRRGNLQDMINANLVNHTRFPEKKMMLLFLGVCKALRHMHHYNANNNNGRERMEMTMPNTNTKAGADVDDEGEQQRPLMHDEPVNSGPGSRSGPTGSGLTGKSYAHRDIKPGNIMIADTGSDPILMDLGSIADSPLPITSRSLAIQTQDIAAEHSTMPYRAPELFDVKTGTVVDTKVDIWSMGCTLYACLVGKSPFEMRSDETGGSLSICVLSGDWRFPDEGPGGKPLKRKNTGSNAPADTANGSGSAGDTTAISEPIRDVVRRCLKVEPAERPDIDELIELMERVVDELPDDGA